MKKIAKTLGFLQIFVAVLALPAGLSMILDPTGSGLGISMEILKSTPFLNFFLPGLFLFIGNGLCHLIGAVLSFWRNSFAGVMGVGLGIFLLIWIVVQVYYIGNISFLQPLFFIIAIVEIILAGVLTINTSSELGN